MRTQNILLVLLVVSLYGCQPEVPASKATAPVAAEPSASPARTEQVAQPVVNEAAAPAPVQQIEPDYAEKAAQPAVKEKITVAVKEKAPQPTPAPATVAPVA